jgi:hypothetical protein
MIRLIPLFGFCAACAPASDATPAPKTYAMQLTAPSPNYKILLNVKAKPAEPSLRQVATLPVPGNAKAIGDIWITRLKERRALLGHGLAGKSPDGPVNMIDTGLTRREFDSWTRQNGWQVPRHINWSFVAEIALPPMSEATKNAIRIWPASTTRTGIQHQALYQGRIELRDGCFFVGEFGQKPDKLAWFHAEIGLDKDSAGYFILRERVSGQMLARLGEQMNWGGPATGEIDPASKRALQKACGPAQIYVVGSPEASERFMTQYPHLRQPQTPPPAPPNHN